MEHYDALTSELISITTNLNVHRKASLYDWLL